MHWTSKWHCRGGSGGAGGGRGQYRGGDCSRAARGRFNAFSSSRLAFRVRTPSSLGEAGRGTAPGRCTGPPNGGNSGGGAGGGRGRYRGGECSRAARRTPFYFSGLRISNRRLARGYTGLIRAAGGRPTWHSLQAAGRGGGTGGPRRGGGPSPTGPSERDPPLEGLRGFGGRRARDTRALFAPRGGGPRGTGGGACGQRGGAAAAWRWAPRGAGVAPPHRLRHAMMHRSVWGGRQPCLGGSLPAPPAGRGAFGGGGQGVADPTQKNRTPLFRHLRPRAR